MEQKNNRKYAKQVLAVFDSLGIFIVDVKERPLGDMSLYIADGEKSYIVKFDSDSFTIFDELNGDGVVLEGEPTMKSKAEIFYELASKELFALQQVLHPVQMAAINLLEDYDKEDQELQQLVDIIDNLQQRFDERRAKAYEERAK